MPLSLDTLLQPLPGDDPCGEDAVFSDLYDRIREARRADDASLSQGDWQSDLKTADWRAAVELSTQALSQSSKDLQPAVWLGEALIGRHGYAGAADACRVLSGLMETYWEGLYPRPDGDDLGERAAKLAWFNQYAERALTQAPLSSGSPPMTLADWQISREVDNLARQNSGAWQAALDEGKPDGERFDQAIVGSGAGFVGDLLAAVESAQQAHADLIRTVDTRFGRQSPSLAGVDQALKRAQQILAKAAQTLGLRGGAGQTPGGADTPDTHAQANRPPEPDTTVAAPSLPPTTSLPLTAPPAASRQQALQQLADIATYFRRTEPHSPVAFLCERAIAWADMPLDQWLAEVVRDDTTLSSIRERIGAS